jgi:hypothetical protein
MMSHFLDPRMESRSAFLGAARDARYSATLLGLCSIASVASAATSNGPVAYVYVSSHLRCSPFISARGMEFGISSSSS